ncbi:MAG TPA: tetratricopeptide repeat protein [candidate division WOR-3 bacterium]|uniref:Tetratricopeptide repeat protein n=1 Tax=candidate division WOR-3 bacterium TaxID=2052148 RepID=A0A7V0XFH4_UNCW3|nr:tetratricopeptide repeat protein [candidate division WOR-3 bacterium]
MPKLIRRSARLLPALLLFAGCAYFNTFYNAQRYYREGVQLSEQRQVGQARSRFEKAVEKSALVLTRWPNSRWADDATFLIGQSYYEMGQYGRAIRHFDQLVLAFPESPLVPRAVYYRGLAMLRNREYGPARVLLDQVRRDYPQLRDGAAFHLASSFHAREDWSRAADSLAVFLEEHPKTRHRLDALRQLAASCARLGRWESCEQSYRRLATLISDPKERASVRFRIADALIAQGRHDEAVPLIREALGRYPDLDDEGHVLLGRALAETGREADALQTWRKVRGSNDFGAEAFFRIGKHHEEHGEFELARAHYDTARSRRGTSEHGIQAIKRLSLLDAIARAESTGVAEPADALFLLAEVHNLNLGEHDEARRLYQQVRDSFPDSDWAPKAMLARAWISRYVEDDSLGAVPELKRLIAEYPRTEYANEAKRWLGLPAPPRPTTVAAASSPPAPPKEPVKTEPPPDPVFVGDTGDEPPPSLPPDPGPDRPPRERPRTPPVSPPGKPARPTEPDPAPGRPEGPQPAPPERPAPPAADTAFGPIRFAFDRADIRDVDTAALGRIATWLREHPARRLRLTGHCDPRGEDDYNLGLGRRRAEAVRAWLERAGIDPVRLETATRGSSETISSGPEGYWRDRRVEFSLL